MVKNRKHWITIVVLLVYSFLMAEEIVLNQVLCYKYDGSVDLEFAFLGFKCMCHLHHSDLPQKTERGTVFFSENCCCFDLLIGNNLFERNLTSIIDLAKTVKYLISGIQLDLFTKTKHNDCRDFFDFLPLSKFLYSPLFQNKSVVLLC